MPQLLPGRNSNGVRVVVRLRPLNAKERLVGANESLQCTSLQDVVVNGGERYFSYDLVADQNTTQQYLFEHCVQPLLERFTNGFNATIFAYGQTGSGKTYTMGTGFEGSLDDSLLGIIPRSVEFLFSQLHSRSSVDADSAVFTEGPSSEQLTYEMNVSFLEIYNEELVDLLAAAAGVRAMPLTIRQEGSGEIVLAGLREQPIATIDDVYDLLRKGSLCRSTGSTEMNMNSSRSHAIFTLLLRQLKKESNESLVSKIHFVDLAGSERLKKTGALGSRARESISINSGLLALGNVISALAAGDLAAKRHVPYRNSKLTRLLQDSLGGNSHTLMIACVSPSSDSLSESLSTLGYAQRAKLITNRAVANTQSASNSAFECSQLRKQVAQLRQELLMLRQEGSLENKDSVVASTVPSYAVLESQLHALQREKTEIEIERDSLRYAKAAPGERNALIDGYVRKINELMSHQKEIERLRTDNGGAVLQQSQSLDQLACCRTPIKGGVSQIRTAATTQISTPRQSARASDDSVGALIETLRRKGSETAALLALAVLPSFLERSRVIEYLKEQAVCYAETASAFEQFRRESASICDRYEDKIKQLSDLLVQAQRTRDEAVHRLSAPVDPALRAEGARAYRQAYEDKIKRACQQASDLKGKLADAQRTFRQQSANNEVSLRNLRASLDQAKIERTRLLQRVAALEGGAAATLTKKSSIRSDDSAASDLAMRRREARAQELVRAWKSIFEKQKELVLRCTDQVRRSKEALHTVRSQESQPPPFSPIAVKPSIADEVFSTESQIVSFIASFCNQLFEGIVSMQEGTDDEELQQALQSFSEVLHDKSKIEALQIDVKKLLNSQSPAFHTVTQRQVLDSISVALYFSLLQQNNQLKASLRKAIANGCILGLSPVGHVSLNPHSITAQFQHTPTRNLEAYINNQRDSALATSKEAVLSTSTILTSPFVSTPGLECIQTMDGHLSQVYDIAWMPSREGRLYSASQDGSLREWDIERGEVVATLCESSAPIRAITCNSQSLFTSFQASIRQWDPRCYALPTASLLNHSDDVYCLMCMEDTYLLSGSCDNTVAVWDLRRSDRAISTLGGHRGTPLSLLSLPDCSLVFTGCWDACVRVFDAGAEFVGRGSLEPGHNDIVTSLATAGRDSLVSVSRDRSMRRWTVSGLGQDELLSVECVRFVPNAHQSWITASCVLSDHADPVLLTGDREGSLSLWHEPTLSVLDATVTARHSATINRLLTFYSGSNEFVASAGGDRVVRVWELKGTSSQ